MALVLTAPTPAGAGSRARPHTPGSVGPFVKTRRLRMPTKIQFTSGESMTLAENLDQVNQQLGSQQLGTQTVGLFKRVEGDNRTRVTVFASAISYLRRCPTGTLAAGF